MIQKDLLASLNSIYKQSKESKLSPNELVKVREEIKYISTHLGVSETATILFAIIASFNINGRDIDISDFSRFLDLEPFEFIANVQFIEELRTKKIIKSKKSRKRSFEHSLGKTYALKKQLIDDLIYKQTIPSLIYEKKSTIIETLESFHELIEQCQNEEIEFEDLENHVLETIEDLKSYDLYHNLALSTLDFIDQIVLLYTIWITISGMRTVDLDSFLRNLLWKNSKRISYLQTYFKDKNKLLTSGLLERRPCNYFNDIEVVLTDYCISLLEEEGLSIVVPKTDRKDAIDPTKINSVELVYNEEESIKLNRIENLLLEANYLNFRKKLEKDSISLGLTFLLYGPPGTGKTETVYQLARKSGREILKIDISNTKSSWFGETEKKIKRIFTDYEKFSKSTEKKPILFFNEADAIFSKRKFSSIESNTQQTENAIQNILLEELDNFDGILFATTNLIKNLDKAFERRFLFKLYLNAPNEESRKKIWAYYFPSLKSTEIRELAQHFHFTGGQINNILRKIKIEELLNNEQISFGEIELLCNEERLSFNSTPQKIGF